MIVEMETEDTMVANGETGGAHEDADQWLARKIEAQHLEEHERYRREKQAQEEKDAELARKLAQQGDGQGAGTPEGVGSGLEAAPVACIVEDSLLIERDAQLALQLQNGRSYSEILRMQAAFGLDAGAVLSQEDVTEKFQKDIMVKIMAASKAGQKSGCNKRHISSDMHYYGSSLHGHGWDCGTPPSPCNNSAGVGAGLPCVNTRLTGGKRPHHAGYKNLQMMFSCLLNDRDVAAHLKKHGIVEVPSVSSWH